MTNVKDMEKFLLSEVAADSGRKSLDPDEDLLEQRLIDSLGILKLVVFLEKANGIKVEDEDVVPENFQSINAMIRFVELKNGNNESAVLDAAGPRVAAVLPIDSPAKKAQKVQEEIAL